MVCWPYALAPGGRTSEGNMNASSEEELGPLECRSLSSALVHRSETV